MKKETAIQQNSDISEVGNVDQIREILFGSQEREVQERFEKLENSIDTIQEQMRKKIEQTQIDFNSKIKNEIESINRKIKNITSQQQDGFADVRDSALKQEKRIQNALEIAKDELTVKYEQLQKQQAQNTTNLRSETESLRDELFNVLNAKVAELGKNKLSRDDAAAIMMEAAMLIKGTQINQKLSLKNVEKK